MSITFCIEAHNEAEDTALISEHAPELNVHIAGGSRLLAALGIEPDHDGTIDAGDLLTRLDARSVSTDGYVTERLPRLREIATAAQRLGRQVVWG